MCLGQLALESAPLVGLRPPSAGDGVYGRSGDNGGVQTGRRRRRVGARAVIAHR